MKTAFVWPPCWPFLLMPWLPKKLAVLQVRGERVLLRVWLVLPLQLGLLLHWLL